MRRLLLIPAEIASRLQRDILLLVLVLLCLGLSLLDPEAIVTYPQRVDWPTIAALAGLLLLTTGLEESSLLQHAAYQMIMRMHSERNLALLLVGAAAAMATVLTNDIALFIAAMCPVPSCSATGAPGGVSMPGRCPSSASLKP